MRASLLLSLLWLVVPVYFSIPAFGYPLSAYWLILLASISALFSILLVLLGESVIEDIVKVVLLLTLSSLLWATKGELGFIIICTVVASASGMLFNHANQWFAGEQIQRTRPHAPLSSDTGERETVASGKKFSDLSDSEKHASFTEVETRISNLVDDLGEDLPLRDRDIVKGYLKYNELGVALEHLCDALLAEDRTVSESQYSEIARLFKKMKMDPTGRLKHLDPLAK
jgi:hypothetical protein